MYSVCRYRDHTVALMCTSVCFKSAIISVLIARSHSDENHVNATAPCMPYTRIHMHFAQARPPVTCIPLVINMWLQYRAIWGLHVAHVRGKGSCLPIA